MQFYRIKNAGPWGDCGAILFHGSATKEHGKVILERTGPCVPPVTRPGSYLVVTGSMRKEMEQCELFDVEFQPVQKERIVELHWEEWDLTSEIMGDEPSDGEPYSFLTDRPHSPQVSEEMGVLWEVVIPAGANVDTDSQRKPWDYDVRVHLSTWNGTHLFRDVCVWLDEGPFILVSEEGKQWLEKRTGQWIYYEPCLVKR